MVHWPTIIQRIDKDLELMDDRCTRRRKEIDSVSREMRDYEGFFRELNDRLVKLEDKVSLSSLPHVW